MAGARNASASDRGCASDRARTHWRDDSRSADFGPRPLARCFWRAKPMKIVNARAGAMTAFLSDCGWAAAERRPLPGDASSRHYIRLHLGARTAMLMDQPGAAEAPTAAPDATPEDRRALGYNALARLAGADCARFVAASRYLRNRGLSAPDIYAADTAQGFLLLEDLGVA